MNKSEEYSERSPFDALYASEMAAALPKGPVRPKSTVQAPSTQRVLDMTEDDLIVYRARGEPENWKANPNAETLDEAVGARCFDAKQVSVVEDIRHKGRNSLGDFKWNGLSSVTQEKRNLAAEAFLYSPPADLTPGELSKVKELTALETVDQKIERKKSLIGMAASAFKSLFTREKHACQVGMGNTCKLCGEVQK